MTDRVELYISRGIEYLNKGLINDAIFELKQALAIDPANPIIHKYLGNAYFDKESYIEAVKEYRESIKLDSNYIDAHFNLGLVYFNMGLYSDAINEYMECLKIDPADADIYAFLANAHLEKGQFNDAKKYSAEAIKIAPDLAIGHFVLGMVYHNMDELDKAREQYLETLKLDSSFEDAKSNLDLIEKGNINASGDQAPIPYIPRGKISNDNLKRNNMDNISKIKMEIVTKLLLENHETLEWGALSETNSDFLDKKSANEFFFCCILDYQMNADYVWSNSRKFIKIALKDPDNLWDVIAAYTLDKWMALSDEYSLHRYPNARKRVWNIAQDIVKHYDGDVRKIWANRDINDARDRIYDLVGGEQIPRMILGALKDHKQVTGTLDVKADVHVCTVLGRVFLGRILTTDEVTRITRMMYPEDPWSIDSPLFSLGKTNCNKSKCYCDTCYLQRECEFFEKEIKNNWIKG